MRSATVVFPVPGFPVKDIWSVARQRELLSRSLDHEKRGDLADPRLDRLEPDELPLKRGQNLVDARAFEFRPQPDRRGRSGGVLRFDGH
jgi:hypothetical protein